MFFGSQLYRPASVSLSSHFARPCKCWSAGASREPPGKIASFLSRFEKISRKAAAAQPFQANEPSIETFGYRGDILDII